MHPIDLLFVVGPVVVLGVLIALTYRKRRKQRIPDTHEQVHTGTVVLLSCAAFILGALGLASQLVLGVGHWVFPS